MNYPAAHQPVPYGYPSQVLVPLPPRYSTGHLVVAWILTVLTSLYLLPWAIAATRSRRSLAPVVLINIFLGWTVLGWIAALVLACLGETRQAVVINYQPTPGYGYPPTASPYPAQHPTPYAQHPAPSAQPQRPALPPQNFPHSQPTAPYPYGQHPEGGYNEPTQILPDPRGPQGY